MLPEIETFCPSNQQEWRQWLEENHQSAKSIWLLMYKKSSKVPSITWSEAVDEALCFGWIDGTRKTNDDKSYIQYFTKRKAKSNWSKINKDKVALLSEKGLMKAAGLESIRIAKENGSWTILDSIENLIIPDVLEVEFKRYPNSKEYFQSLSKSKKKMILYWVKEAKRPETKEKRVKEIAKLAGEGLLPKQFR